MWPILILTFFMMHMLTSQIINALRWKRGRGETLSNWMAAITFIIEDLAVVWAVSKLAGAF